MRIGIIAEGFTDITIIKAILKATKGIDGSEIIPIRPKEHTDETDLSASNFSNWTLVLQECQNEQTFENFFDIIDEKSFLVIQIDAAEHGEAGYDIPNPRREKDTDWKIYSKQLYIQIKSKIENLIPIPYQQYVKYAVTIEETDAWLIPLFENIKDDTARYANPKEHLQKLIGTLKGKEKQKYINTNKKSLDYNMIAKGFKKGLNICRKKNVSLDIFCISIEELPD